MAGVSVFHFSRCFRDAIGMTPHDDVMTRRTERAKLMLRDTPTSLADVAFGCGFASQSHMTDVFMCRVGASPGRYRRECAG